MTTPAVEHGPRADRVAAPLLRRRRRPGGRRARPDARRPLRADLPGRDRARAPGRQVGAPRTEGGRPARHAAPGPDHRALAPTGVPVPADRRHRRRASRPGSPCSWSRASPSSRCSTTPRCSRRWPRPGCCAPPRSCRPCTTYPSTRCRSTPAPLSPVDELARWARTMAAVPPDLVPDARPAARAARRVGADRRSSPRWCTATTGSAT